MIKLKEKMPLSLDGVTVTDCTKGQIVSLSPQLEKKLIAEDKAEGVKQIVVTKPGKQNKKTGKKEK